MPLSPLVLVSVNGFDAVVESYALDRGTRTVRLLSLIGQPQAIKAIRASISVGLPVELTGIGTLMWVQSKSSLFHVVHKRLASGSHAILWLPLPGTTFGIEPGQPAYLIHRGPRPAGPPPSFLQTLDRVLACPILPEWAGPLWAAAVKYHWVRPLDCLHCHVWELGVHDDAMIEWIHRQLTRKKLPIPRADPSLVAA